MRLLKFVFIFFAVLSILSVSAVLVVNYTLPKIQDNVSILILGKGSEGHTAPDLTDTIMLVNLNPDLNKITVLSLPRDIWIPPIRAKINSAYHYGGFKMISESVNYVVGVMPKFYVVIDFSLFKDFIDAMGGINVDVANSFVDERYPIAGKENDLCDGDKTYKCRYETVRFDQGLQLMDGETALKFVRSRNAVGDEGTDLAREARQQRVINALKNKLLSPKILADPKAIKNLYQVFKINVETNIDPETAISMAWFVAKFGNNFNFLSIPEEFIKISQKDKKYDFQYVFLPAGNNWDNLKAWIRKVI